MTAKEVMIEKYFLLLPQDVRTSHLIKYLDAFEYRTKTALSNTLKMCICLLLISYGLIMYIDNKLLGWTIPISIVILVVASQRTKVSEISKFSKSVKNGYYPLHYSRIVFPDNKAIEYFKTNLGISSDYDYGEFIKAGGDELLEKIIKTNLRNYYWYKY